MAAGVSHVLEAGLARPNARPRHRPGRCWFPAWPPAFSGALASSSNATLSVGPPFNFGSTWIVRSKIVDCERLDLAGSHGGQVLVAEVAAHVLDVVGDASGECARVEDLRAVLGDGAQGAGQVGHRHTLDRIGLDRGGCERRIAIEQEAGACAGITDEVGHCRRDHQRRVPVDDRSLLGDLDCGGHKVAPCLATIAPVRRCQSGRDRRRNYGLGTDRIDVAHHHRPSKEVALVTLVRQHKVSAIQRLRRTSAKVDADGLCGGGLVDE